MHFLNLVTVLCLMALTDPPAQQPPSGLGRIEVRIRYAHGLSRFSCPAVLVTEELALLQAHCLDPIYRPAKAYTALLKVPADMRLRTDAYESEVEEFVLHPEYEQVQCAIIPWLRSAACKQAIGWCKQVGGHDCRGQAPFYARTFMPGSSHDLAIATLKRGATPEHVAWMSPPQDERFSATAAPLMAWSLDEGMNISGLPLPQLTDERVPPDPCEATLAVMGDEAAVGYASIELQGRHAVAALPSHYARLAADSMTGTAYRYSRVDAELSWLQSARAHACATAGKCSTLRMAYPPEPAPDPKPPEPQPPEPQPQPPEPQPQPPEPQPQPPEPQPAPGDANSPQGCRQVAPAWPLLAAAWLWTRRRGYGFQL